jgi:arylsulfatase A-like enzyme
MVRRDNWKIVQVNDGPWQLYNMRKVPSELNNLANKMPEQVSELEKHYRNYLGK